MVISYAMVCLFKLPKSMIKNSEIFHLKSFNAFLKGSLTEKNKTTKQFENVQNIKFKKKQ